MQRWARDAAEQVSVCGLVFVSYINIFKTTVTDVSMRAMPSSGVGVLKGLLYAVGGHDGPLVRKSCEVYDPASNSWRQVADMNMCRRNAGKTVRACPPDIFRCEMSLR